jgi:hypothetical protein
MLWNQSFLQEEQPG